MRNQVGLLLDHLARAPLLIALNVELKSFVRAYNSRDRNAPPKGTRASKGRGFPRIASSAETPAGVWRMPRKA